MISLLRRIGVFKPRVSLTPHRKIRALKVMKFSVAGSPVADWFSVTAQPKLYWRLDEIEHFQLDARAELRS